MPVSDSYQAARICMVVVIAVAVNHILAHHAYNKTRVIQDAVGVIATTHAYIVCAAVTRI